jgi:hypothetical protein
MCDDAGSDRGYRFGGPEFVDGIVAGIGAGLDRTGLIAAIARR